MLLLSVLLSFAGAPPHLIRVAWVAAYRRLCSLRRPEQPSQNGPRCLVSGGAAGRLPQLLPYGSGAYFGLYCPSPAAPPLLMKAILGGIVDRPRGAPLFLAPALLEKPQCRQRGGVSRKRKPRWPPAMLPARVPLTLGVPHSGTCLSGSRLSSAKSPARISRPCWIRAWPTLKSGYVFFFFTFAERQKHSRLLCRASRTPFGMPSVSKHFWPDSFLPVKKTRTRPLTRPTGRPMATNWRKANSRRCVRACG